MEHESKGITLILGWLVGLFVLDGINILPFSLNDQFEVVKGMYVLDPKVSMIHGSTPTPTPTLGPRYVTVTVQAVT